MGRPVIIFQCTHIMLPCFAIGEILKFGGGGAKELCGSTLDMRFKPQLLMMQKIVSMNSSSIQMDEHVGFVWRRTWQCSSYLALQLLVLSFSPCQYGWTKALDSSRDKPAMRYEIEKYGYIGVMFAKYPPTIKLE